MSSPTTQVPSPNDVAGPAGFAGAVAALDCGSVFDAGAAASVGTEFAVGALAWFAVDAVPAKPRKISDTKQIVWTRNAGGC